MSSKLRNNFNYNINGARALAVFLVFLFHVNINNFSGGYIGVDIFFVISGYVVSLSLYNIFNKHNDFISTAIIFYKKRILRILPAILFLSLFLLIILNFLFIKKHFLLFLKSLLYSNIFLSNYYFWNESGYFGLENSFKPMLHTWSLSVEAQIYFAFPFLIYFLYKKNFFLFWLFAFITSALSIFLAEIFIDRPFVYFFPIFRIHEFIVGIIIFYYLHFLSKKKLNHIYNIVGIIVILFSAIYLNKHSDFPGLNSLLPLVGISLILLSEDKKTFLLNNKITQFFGNISYSFYLYHWPVIIIFKYFFLITSFSLLDILIIFFITLGFSSFSYKFIELKFKKVDKKNFINISGLLLISIIIIFTLNFNYKKDFTIINQDFFNTEIESRKIFLEKIKKKSNFSDKKIFIIGDSHAQDIYISISQNKKNLLNFTAIYIPLNDTCLKYLKDKTLFNFIENKLTTKFKVAGQGYCNEQLKKFENNLEKINNDSVLITNRWSKNTINHVDHLIDILKEKNNKIILIGRRPTFFNVPSLLEINEKRKLGSLNHLSFKLNDKRVININNSLEFKAKRKKINFLNIYNMICINKNKECEITDNKNNLLIIDNDHFSMIGSKYFGNKIVKNLQKYIE